MILLAQVDLPIVEGMMDASNSLIIDQGIAIFAVVVFAIVIFGMMGLMFMMQRQTGAMLHQMGKESSQQDKLITENALNRVDAQRNTDELIDVKDLLAKLIDTQTQGNNDKHVAIQNGIQTIEKMDESVTDMQLELETLNQNIRELIDNYTGEAKLSETDKNDIATKVSAAVIAMIPGAIKDVISDIATLQNTETEIPTVKLEAITVEAPGVPVAPKPEADSAKEGTK